MIDCKIVIVDDSPTVLKTLHRLLSPEFKVVVPVSNPAILPALLKDEGLDVVLLDLNYTLGIRSGKEGLFWINRILEYPFPPVVIAITAFADIDLAISAFKSGAVDFVIKPWNNEKLIAGIKNALNKRHKKELHAEESDILKDFLDYLMGKYARLYGKRVPTLSEEAKKKLRELMQTGKIELLDLCIEQTILLSDSSDLKDSDFHLKNMELKTLPLLSLQDMEKQLIRFMLNEKGRNLSATAQSLNISRQTLYNKMKKYNL